MQLELHSFNPSDFSWKGLTLTVTAVTYIRKLISKNPGVLGIRLRVKKQGCAGFSYVLDTISKSEKDYLLFEQDGARIYVPLQVMPFVDGTKVDYVFEGLNQSIKFYNPKAKNKCGCGKSFNLQDIII